MKMEHTPGEIRTLQDSGEIGREAAQEFCHLAGEAVQARGVFTVALSGGSTPKKLYSLLADEDEPYRNMVPWKNIKVFWGDERCVPPDHPESNYRMAHDALLSKVPVEKTSVFRMEGEHPLPRKAAGTYEGLLRRVFRLGAEEVPRFDLIFLGLGSDGHTASLFPGSEVIFNRKDLVAATLVEKFGSYRLTMTPLVLCGAAKVIFLVSGRDKGDAVQSVLQGDYQPGRFPAQVVHPLQGKLLWLIDRSAARLLI